MTYEEYRAAAMDVVYLAACAVNNTVPEASRVEKMDLDSLYKAASRHLLTGITAMALESAGLSDEAFIQARGKAIRKVAAFDMERAAIISKMEEAGIWYMPLKGAILKTLYPKIGMRQMADNDILCDDSRMDDVRTIMEELGYVTDETYGMGNHDHYLKPPVFNFEMHRSLFGLGHDEKMVEYYKDVKNRLILNEGSAFGYHFSDEDFYIYMLAHEYKHFAASGTGLRSVLDTYVYLKHKGDSMDYSYITGELEKLGLSDFESKNRSLAEHLFGGESLTEQDQDMLEYILSSGTYGSIQNRVRNDIRKYGKGPFAKLRYVLRRLFLPMDVIRIAFPLFTKYPILLPFLPLYRLFRRAPGKSSRLLSELKTIAKVKSRD